MARRQHSVGGMTAQHYRPGRTRHRYWPIRRNQPVIGHLEPLHRQAGRQQAKALVRVEAVQKSQLPFAATLEFENWRPGGYFLLHTDDGKLDQFVAKIKLQHGPQLRLSQRVPGRRRRKDKPRCRGGPGDRGKLRRQRAAEPGQREAQAITQSIRCGHGSVLQPGRMTVTGRMSAAAWRNLANSGFWPHHTETTGQSWYTARNAGQYLSR